MTYDTMSSVELVRALRWARDARPILAELARRHREPVPYVYLRFDGLDARKHLRASA